MLSDGPDLVFHVVDSGDGVAEADADVRNGPDGQPVTVEREAGFAKRRGKAFFGFKAHVAVDEGSGLVRRAILTPANVNESVVADALRECPIFCV